MVHMPLELGLAHAARLRQEALDRLDPDRGVAANDGLYAVAGGEDHRLLDPRNPAQLGELIHDLVRGESQALAERHGSGTMVAPEEDQHGR